MSFVILGSTRLKFRTTVCVCALGIALLSIRISVAAQESEKSTRRSVEVGNGYIDDSPLEKNNLNHVAASAAQIREVLVKDAGILVELKRWVAKEATDSGQLVDDTALTDQAIFQRLDEDVEFRSVATRLVQHYGYLLPTINPESQQGKQQELVLKERARRLVQVEEQENSEGLPLDVPRRNAESAHPVLCDKQADSNCEETENEDRERARRGETSQPSAEPSWQETPPLSAKEILRAAIDQNDRQRGVSRTRAEFGLASDRLSRFQDGSTSLQSTLDPSLLGRTQIFDALGAAPDPETILATTPAKSDNENIVYPERRAKPPANGASVPSIEHRINPYSDIPSLYDLNVQAVMPGRAPERFGLAFFRNGWRAQGAMAQDLPVGPDYVVGPGDGLSIDLWGGFSQRLVRTVDRQGKIMLPEAGPLLVSGRTLGEVQEAVQKALRTQFQDTSADVSLSRLRTIRVYVVGELAEPGAYDIGSLSSPLNALLAAGGVTSRGSLRALKHYRGKQLLEEVDAYDLLLRGVSLDAKRLESGDSLMVPPVGAQVTVSGMVRRPAIYELRDEKSFADVLELAGGILPAAALQHIEVQRLEAHEKRTMLSVDLSSGRVDTVLPKQLSEIQVHDGDEIHIFPIAPYNTDAVYLQGHVLRPGRYSYREGMKLTDLVASYKDLLPEPASKYAEIVRLNAPDFRPSVESFDLSKALADPAAAPTLKALDTVRIFSRYDFEPAPMVSVSGEVRAPGQYRTAGQIRLQDAIHLAGGLSPDAALDSAQLFRVQEDGTLKVLSFNLAEAMAGDVRQNLLLEPRDRLLIHRNVSKTDPATVYVKGEVPKPGRYPLAANMRVEDLIRVAGGLKRSADGTMGDLTRYAASDGHQISTESRSIQLSAALSGDDEQNVLLHDGDVLTVRQVPGWNDIAASMTVKGEVQHAGSYGIRPGERLSSLIARAGGFAPEASPYGAVLMRREVRDLEMKSYSELVQRVKAEQVNLKALPENSANERNAKLTAIAQSDVALTQLEANQPVGRVVIHIQENVSSWRNTSADVVVRDGDVLLIPKKANYVTVTGQVFNSTAVSYRPGHSAKWYLSQAGGLTQLADKKAVFVIRADGSVVGAKNNSGLWTSDPLNAVLKPGDSIVVPEKAPNIGGRSWSNVFQAAQAASSLAFAIAYFKP